MESLMHGLIVAAVPSIITLLVNIFLVYRRDTKRELAQMRMKLREFMLEEPFLREEFDKFESSLTGTDEERKFRRKQYRTFWHSVFEYIEDVCKYNFYFNKEHFVKKFRIKRMILKSRELWLKNIDEYHDKYDSKFINFMESYYKKNISAQPKSPKPPKESEALGNKGITSDPAETENKKEG